MTLLLAPVLVACTGKTEPPSNEDATGWVFVEQPAFSLPGQVTDMVETGGTLLVANRGGTVTGYTFDGTQLGSFVLDVHEDQACGLISLALDPDFATNGLLYYGACTSMTRSAVFRATVDLTAWTATDAVEVIGAGDGDAGEPWHNVGWLGFDAEGALYATFGDKTLQVNAQDTSKILGSVVRVWPNKQAGAGGYTPHADNVFDGTTGHDAIFAWGFRSPWTATFDHRGRLWLVDVGTNEDGYEELDLVTQGGNYGWGDHEGPCTDCQGTTPPVLAWPHVSGHRYFVEDDDVVATNLRVGWVYPGPTGGDDPYGGRLADRLLFGDLCLGFVRSVAVDDNGVVTADEALGHLSGAAWVQSPDGHLYGSTLEGCTGATVGEVSSMYKLTWVDPP